MYYLAESTRELIDETTDALIVSGKDPIFLIESFIINNKRLFTEGALSNLWRDVKNWWKGGSGAVAAGRHDIADEYDQAKKALLTMVSHIKKFAGSDPSTENDILRLLYTTVTNLNTAEPLIKTLSSKVKKRAAAARDPRLYGGPEEYKPDVDVSDFASIPTSDVKAPGGTKLVMEWFVNLRSSNKTKLMQSILMNARVRQAPTEYLVIGEKDYDKLVTASDPLITALAGLGIRNKEMYAKVFAYLYQKLLSGKPPEPDTDTLSDKFPVYTKELKEFKQTDIVQYLNWMATLSPAEISDIQKKTEAAMGSIKVTDIVGASKVNSISTAISKHKEAAPPVKSALGSIDELELLKMFAYVVMKAREKAHHP